jgi:hypothetical protein
MDFVKVTCARGSPPHQIQSVAAATQIISEGLMFPLKYDELKKKGLPMAAPFLLPVALV